MFINILFVRANIPIFAFNHIQIFVCFYTCFGFSDCKYPTLAPSRAGTKTDDYIYNHSEHKKMNHILSPWNKYRYIIWKIVLLRSNFVYLNFFASKCIHLLWLRAHHNHCLMTIGKKKKHWKFLQYPHSLK